MQDLPRGEAGRGAHVCRLGRASGVGAPRRGWLSSQARRAARREAAVFAAPESGPEPALPAPKAAGKPASCPRPTCLPACSPARPPLLARRCSATAWCCPACTSSTATRASSGTAPPAPAVRLATAPSPASRRLSCTASLTGAGPRSRPHNVEGTQRTAACASKPRVCPANPADCAWLCGNLCVGRNAWRCCRMPSAALAHCRASAAGLPPSCPVLASWQPLSQIKRRACLLGRSPALQHASPAWPLCGLQQPLLSQRIARSKVARLAFFVSYAHHLLPSAMQTLFFSLYLHARASVLTLFLWPAPSSLALKHTFDFAASLCQVLPPFFILCPALHRTISLLPALA